MEIVVHGADLYITLMTCAGPQFSTPDIKNLKRQHDQSLVVLSPYAHDLNSATKFEAGAVSTTWSCVLALL